MKPKHGDIIAVWFSCGGASAVAAKKTIELYGDICTVIVVNNPIKEEDNDNRRFLADVEKWIGQKILSATNKNFPNASCVEVWDKRKYMGGIKGAPCTQILKREARQQWEANNKFDWMVFGYGADEKKRHDDFVLSERENVLPVLIELGITKDDCISIVRDAGIEIPMAYRLGYNNANCYGCIKATSPTYWNHVRITKPEVFKERAEQSRRIGARLVRVKGKRIFLDELKETDKGRPMKSLPSVECGIFCKPEKAK